MTSQKVTKCHKASQGAGVQVGRVRLATPVQQQPQHYIELDPETHTYYVDGEPEIGVTSVLHANGLIDDRWYTEYGRWRGSAVHKATHYFDDGDIDRRTLDPAIKPFVADWKKFRDDTGFTPTLIEVPLYDPLHRYCGTPDRVGYFGWNKESKDSNVLLDLKAYPNGQIPEWVRYQMAAYGRLVDPKKVFHRFAVQLTGDGPKIESYPTDSYVDDVNDFLACVRVARLHQKLKRGGSNGDAAAVTH